MPKQKAFFIVRFSVEHPWLIIILSLLTTLALALPIMNLKIQADIETLLPEGSVAADNTSSLDTVNLDKILVMVQGDELFSVDKLKLFEKTIKELEEFLPVAQTIDPFSMPALEKAGARLMGVSLSPGGRAPSTEEELKTFIARLNNSRFAPGSVTSFGRDVLAVYFLVEKTGEYRKMVSGVEEILLPLRQVLDVSMTGTVPFSAETEKFLTEGIGRLLIFVLLTILVSYYFGFKSKRAVFLPITLVISGTVFALGVMSLIGFQLTMVSIIAPPLILTLGSSYSIHVMNAYYSAVHTSTESKKELIINSVSGISGTVIFASLTTILGLMSLLSATISQTREFAITTAIGIFVTSILSITLLPAFLALQPVPEKMKVKSLHNDPLSRVLIHFGPKFIKGRIRTIIIIAVITISFIILLPKVVFNTSPSKYFPDSSSVIIEHNKFLSKIGGYDEFEIVLTGTEKGYFLKPEVLDNIYSIEKELEANPDISYIFSFPKYLDYAGYVMTGIEGNFKSRGLTLFVSRLFGAADFNTEVVNDDYSKISIILRVLNSREILPIDEKDVKILVEDISRVLQSGLRNDIEWEIKGLGLEFVKLSEQMQKDLLRSTIVALFLISIASSIAFKSVFKGLLALIPLLMGIFLSLILMVLFNIPLDMTTIMASCITIGVGVDDSIHFLLHHRKMNNKYPDDNERAIKETIFRAGRPIIITTLSITAGLLLLATAQFQPIRYFGLIIVFTLLAACFSTIVLLPSLIGYTRKKNV